MRGWAHCGLPATLLLLLGTPAVRGWLESRMSLHMAAELPLLLLCGWLMAGAAQVRCRLIECVDAQGLLTATAASSVLALWMLPTALDMALIEPGVALLKYAQWACAGALLRSARARYSPVIATFFLVNAAWMTATAGLLYLDAEQQLCVNYLVDDQQAAGFALLAWAVALAALAGLALRPLLATSGDASTHRTGSAPCQSTARGTL
jgi:hypothetical protein